jgi:hypothetical protein
MPQKCETPPSEGGASRNMLGGWFQDASSPSELQVQMLIALHHVRPEIAATIAALAFGGGANG